MRNWHQRCPRSTFPCAFRTFLCTELNSPFARGNKFLCWTFFNIWYNISIRRRMPTPQLRITHYALRIKIAWTGCSVTLQRETGAPLVHYKNNRYKICSHERMASSASYREMCGTHMGPCIGGTAGA